MKATTLTLLTLLTFSFTWNSLRAQESTKVFDNGSDKLVIYTDVPGLPASQYYKIRVRSNATGNEWVESFALVTRSLYSESQENYFDILEGWTHTYTNIEMNGAVEIEIAKYDGSPITKAAVHPVAKANEPVLVDGKAYFTMEKPALIAIDIDGQMDDQNTGIYSTGGGGVDQYDGPPIHTVCVYAHPVFEKPEPDGEGVVLVEPGSAPPTDKETYTTVCFAPGVHNIGKDYPVFSNKQYFIPGDAIVYGTMGSHIDNNGDNIKIFGVGTLSGDSLKHPNYDPEFEYESASPSNARPWKPISITDAYNVNIEGICIANPAFHAISLPWKTLDRKVTFVRWAKVISWRGNGDGVGNAHVMEDCFLRTQDDATYVKGDRRRLVIWNDANGSAFVQQGILDNFPIYVEDCDVIYSRAYWHRWDGGRVFCGRPISGVGKKEVNVLYRDIRITDPRPCLQIFDIHSSDDLPPEYNSPSGDIGGSFSGITYQNVTAVSGSILNFPEILRGCEQSPYSDLTFEDVVIDGKIITKLDDFSFVNEWVTNITFNPVVTDDATLFDLYLDGVSMPEFSPEIENYTLDFPFGTLEYPHVEATRMDYDATVEVTQADGLPGKATIVVTAEDGSTTKTYTVNFTLGSDEITGFIAPQVVAPREIVSTTVSYSATAERDIRVFIQLNSPPWDNYGGTTVRVPMGKGEVEVVLEIDPSIELLDNAYKIVADLLPIGGGWPERIDEVKIEGVSAVSPYSSDASLSNLTIDGATVSGFDSGTASYDIIFPAGTVDVPEISAVANHENARVEITDVESLPGSATILVTAEDSTTTKVYTVNLLLEELSNLVAPEEVFQGESCTVSVAYLTASERDIQVSLQLNSDPWTNYGTNTVNVSAGEGTVDVELVVDTSIPEATGAYKISVALLPKDGQWADRLDELVQSNIGAAKPYSNDAGLSDLKVNGISITNFEAGTTEYNVELPAGTVDVPVVEGISNDENANITVSELQSLPGSVNVLVTAEDGETTTTYTIHFTVALADQITGINAPDEVIQGDTITVSVTYSANDSRSLIVFLQQSNEPFTNYGNNIVSVEKGTGSLDVDLIVSEAIPVATDVYEIGAALIPLGGTIDEAFDVKSIVEVDVAKINWSRDLNGNNNDLTIFPNPFDNEIRIQTYTNSDFLIYHVNGRSVFYGKTNDTDEIFKINTSSWVKGVYIIRTSSGGVCKLVKQ